MKKFTYSGTSLALLASLAFAPAVSFAQINVGTDATSSLNGVVEMGSSTTDAIIEINSDTSATTSDEGTDVDSNTSATVSLRLNAEGVAITSASEVENEADLEVFAHNFASQEEKVDSASAETTADSKSHVEVVYKHKGKLFGVIPVTIKSTTVVVSGNGEVEVDSSLPWWSFMVTDKNHAAAEVETRVKDNATILMSAELEANATVQAEIMEAIATELESHTSAHASING